MCGWAKFCCVLIPENQWHSNKAVWDSGHETLAKGWIGAFWPDRLQSSRRRQTTKNSSTRLNLAMPCAMPVLKSNLTEALETRPVDTSNPVWFTEPPPTTPLPVADAQGGRAETWCFRCLQRSRWAFACCGLLFPLLAYKGSLIWQWIQAPVPPVLWMLA